MHAVCAGAQKRPYCSSLTAASNLFFSPLIEQIQIAASSAGFQIAVNHIDEQEDEVQFASRLCTELRPAGVIFLGGDMRNFKRSFARIKLPCILSTANAEELGFENLSSVSVDDYDGGRAAAEQLFDRGHKKSRGTRRRPQLLRSFGIALRRVFSVCS